MNQARQETRNQAPQTTRSSALAVPGCAGLGSSIWQSARPGCAEAKPEKGPEGLGSTEMGFVPLDA